MDKKIEEVPLDTLRHALDMMNVHVVEATTDYVYEDADGNEATAPEVLFSAYIWTFESSTDELIPMLLHKLLEEKSDHTTFVFFNARTLEDRQQLTLELKGSFITPRAQDYVPDA